MLCCEDATEINIHSYINEDGVVRRDVMLSEKEIRRCNVKQELFVPIKNWAKNLFQTYSRHTSSRQTFLLTCDDIR